MPQMTPDERSELSMLRALYDLDKPPVAVMRPIPDARLRRLVELERKDAAETAHEHLPVATLGRLGPDGSVRLPDGVVRRVALRPGDVVHAALMDDRTIRFLTADEGGRQ